MATLSRGIPACDIECGIMPPDPDPRGEHKDEKYNLYHDRVAYAHGGVDSSVKFANFFRDDQMPFDKSLYDRPKALMNDQLSHDQRRQGNQKPYVGLDVAKKGKLCSA